MGQRAETLVPCAALALQGPFIAFLSRQSPAGYIALSALLGTLALGLGAFLGRPRARGVVRDLAVMSSTGTLAMLVGLFADAGFRPLVGSGSCLCGCTGSPTGLGLISGFHWMQGCMLATCAALTLLAVRQLPVPPSLGRISLRVVASSTLMLAGMAVAGWAVGSLRLQSPTLALFAAYPAMSAGMAAGAALAPRLRLGTHGFPDSSGAPSRGGWALATIVK